MYRKKVIFILCIVVVLSGLFGVIKYQLSPKDTLLPSNFYGTSFPLYGPNWLPKGWFVHQNSFDATSAVATFTVNDGTGQRLVLTQQPKPPLSQIDEFYNQQLFGATSVQTTAGSVMIGQFDNSLLAGLVTDQTWILIRAVTQIDRSELQRIVSNLKQDIR